MTSLAGQPNPPPRDDFSTRRAEETTNTRITPLVLVQSLGTATSIYTVLRRFVADATEMHHYPNMGRGLSRDWGEHRGF